MSSPKISVINYIKKRKTTCDHTNLYCDELQSEFYCTLSCKCNIYNFYDLGILKECFGGRITSFCELKVLSVNPV